LHPIEIDIRAWSEEFLEKPSDKLGGLPPCPYARKAWLNNRVHFSIHESFDSLFNVVYNYTQDTSICDVLIWASYEIPDQPYFEGVVDGINETFSLLKKDVYLMGFHPDFDAEDADFDLLSSYQFQGEEEKEYVMVFLQPLSKLDDASLELEKTDYYKSFPDHIYNSLILDRRRLRNGYES